MRVKFKSNMFRFYQTPPPTRPQRDPGISRDPGIELKSRSREFFGIYDSKQNDDFKSFHWFLNKKIPKNPGMKILG